MRLCYKSKPSFDQKLCRKSLTVIPLSHLVPAVSMAKYLQLYCTVHSAADTQDTTAAEPTDALGQKSGPVNHHLQRAGRPQISVLLPRDLKAHCRTK